MRRALTAALIVCIAAWAGCESTPKKEATEKPAKPEPEETEQSPHRAPPLPEIEQKRLAALDIPTLSARTRHRRQVRPGRPGRVRGRLDVPLRRQWNYIVVHHSGTDSGSEAAFDRYHRQVRGWRGVGYDFVIGNGNGTPDGVIEVTFRWEKQIAGAHAGVDRYNQHGIGICLVGDFARNRPTSRQMDSLVQLVSYLQDRCHIPSSCILGHRHVKSTRCPGENFPYFEFISRLPH